MFYFLACSKIFMFNAHNSLIYSYSFVLINLILKLIFLDKELFL